MPLQVTIPLHEDRTVLQDKHQLAADTDLMVECVSFALAKALNRAAKQTWPDLKGIYVDCMMAARTAQTDAARFEKKHGDLVFGCTVNLKKLHELDAGSQCLAIMQTCLAPLEAELKKRKKTALSEIAGTFHASLSMTFVRHCLAQHGDRFPHLQEDAPPPKPLKRKARFRKRVIGNLSARKGELWLMFRTGDRHDADIASQVADSVRAVVRRHRLGRYTGFSAGTESAEITFAVASQSETAGIIARHLDDHYPDLYFILSDEYETVFDT